MQRNKQMANRLLGILVEGCEGGGMRRNAIHLTYQGDKIRSTSTENLWDMIDYHLEALETAGLVMRVKDQQDVDDIFSMTLAGHKYLETSR